MSISRNALKHHGTVNAQNLQKLLDDLEREEEIHAETKKREMGIHLSPTAIVVRL